MALRFRKVRRLRGSRTHGWGRVGQHRNSGQKGGHGNAGLHKHKWTWTVKYAPDHFGRDSLNPPTRQIVKRWINVGQLDVMASQFHGGAGSKKGLMTIDLRKFGYEKLLGTSSVKGSYEVHVPATSKSAKQKVEEAGGKVVTEVLK